MQILLVDDHEGFRMALSGALGMVDGLEVAGEAGDGPEAVEACQALRPDLVVMDLSMPGMSGIDATRKIHQRIPGLPVIILTAHADPAIERDAIAAGASAFLAKGSPFEDLVAAIFGAATPRRRADTA